MNKDKMYTQDEIISKENNENVIYYDPSESEMKTMKDLPKKQEILDDILEIMEYMCKKDMILLKKQNIDKYNEKLEEQFEQFATRYYTLFKIIISGGDITPLIIMLDSIEKMKYGNLTQDTAEKEVGEYLQEKFFYPSLSQEKQNEIRHATNK
jgi:Ni/Fe-hydrogenase subunit HybB-like protein